MCIYIYMYLYYIFIFILYVCLYIYMSIFPLKPCLNHMKGEFEDPHIILGPPMDDEIVGSGLQSAHDLTQICHREICDMCW